MRAGAGGAVRPVSAAVEGGRFSASPSRRRRGTTHLNLVERAVEVDRRRALAVHGDDVAARLGEVRHAELRLDDHKVRVERLVRHRAERVDDERPDGDVGHEASVHDVDVDPVAARLVHRLHLRAEVREVRAQDGGAHDDVVLAELVDARSVSGRARGRRAARGGAAEGLVRLGARGGGLGVHHRRRRGSREGDTRRELWGAPPPLVRPR